MSLGWFKILLLVLSLALGGSSALASPAVRCSQAQVTQGIRLGSVAWNVIRMSDGTDLGLMLTNRTIYTDNGPETVFLGSFYTRSQSADEAGFLIPAQSLKFTEVNANDPGLIKIVLKGRKNNSNEKLRVTLHFTEATLTNENPSPHEITLEVEKNSNSEFPLITPIKKYQTSDMRSFRHEDAIGSSAVHVPNIPTLKEVQVATSSFGNELASMIEGFARQGLLEKRHLDSLRGLTSIASPVFNHPRVLNWSNLNAHANKHRLDTETDSWMAYHSLIQSFAKDNDPWNLFYDVPDQNQIVKFNPRVGYYLVLNRTTGAFITLFKINGTTTTDRLLEFIRKISNFKAKYK